MKGRQKTPTPLRILRTTAKDAERLLKTQIPTPGGPLEAPDWLSADQKADWQYAIENAPRDVLKRIDKAVLAAFIVAQDTHHKATVLLATSQLLVKSPKQGIPTQNPYLPIINRQAVLMIRAAGELGFSPCSRARIEGGIALTPPVSDWDEIASG
jgi:P27 family predicted phage terminase small subunit